MKMRDLLSIEWVFPCLRARDKQDALRKLATFVAADTAVPQRALVDAVLEGGELPAFGPAAGVCLSHAFLHGLDRPIVAFARLESAVDFGAEDGCKVDLLALLLSPVEPPGEHLQALACIARTLRTPNVGDLLRAAKGRDALYVILSGTEDGDWSPEPASTETEVASRQEYR